MPNALIDATIEDAISLMVAGVIMAYFSLSKISTALAISVFSTIGAILLVAVGYQVYLYRQHLDVRHKQKVTAIRERRRSRSISAASSSPSPKLLKASAPGIDDGGSGTSLRTPGPPTEELHHAETGLFSGMTSSSDGGTPPLSNTSSSLVQEGEKDAEQGG